MQIPTFTLAAAGVIVIASVTLNTSHKRSQSSKHRRNSGNWGSLSSTGSGGSGGSGSSGGNGGSGSGASSVNFNRAMQFPSPEFQPSLSSARASPPRQSLYTLSRNNARHTRTHSLNRNMPHTPSATVSMAEVLHSRKPFSGSPAAKAQPGGAPAVGSTRRNHYPSQSLSAINFSDGMHRRTDSRRLVDLNPYPSRLMGGQDPTSERRDQRIPAPILNSN